MRVEIVALARAFGDAPDGDCLLVRLAADDRVVRGLRRPDPLPAILRAILPSLASPLVPDIADPPGPRLEPLTQAGVQPQRGRPLHGQVILERRVAEAAPDVMGRPSVAPAASP